MGPEPELLEKVLSPGFVIAGEEYDEDMKFPEIPRGPSPVALYYSNSCWKLKSNDLLHAR